MENAKKSHRGLKICCGLTAIVFITVLAVLVILFLTLLRPKQPNITAEPVSLESFKLVYFPVIRLNVVLGIIVTVDNPNYGGFKYHESTANVSYRGNVVAEAAIPDDMIPARRKHNISTSLNIFADKLVTDANFLADYFSGILNFTSATTLHGKVSILKVFKVKATSSTTCDISLFIPAQRVDSVCQSKVGF